MKQFQTARQLFLLVVILLAARTGVSQAPASGFDKDRGRDILNVIKTDLKKNYYDPSFHGLEVDAHFKTAGEKIKTATSLGQVFGIIAQTLVDLEDSHTFFLPPGRAARTEYGWRMQMIGDKCFVTAVKPGTDAESKGLKPGDEISVISGTIPIRDNFWKIEYYFYALRPQPGVKLTVRRPGGQEAELPVLAKITPLKRVVDLSKGDIFELIRENENAMHFDRQRYYEIGDDLLIWKMPNFEIEENQVDEVMSKVRKHKALILDLRGNPGGYSLTLQRLAGYFFDHDVKIAELKGRKEMKPLQAKTRGDKTFNGQLVVLVDSRSASAAEIFSRLMQLEKRGIVIGDRTAGAVMQSLAFPHESGTDVVALWGVSITNADVIMSDSKSLEKVGVNPDELLLPTAADLAAGRDPVLARAAQLVGAKLDPAKAGGLFPIEWRK